MKPWSLVICITLTALLPDCPSWSQVNHSPFTSMEQCIECHHRVLPTHVLGRPTSMTEPFPLDASGRMECFTCHNCDSGACVKRGNTAGLCEVCHNCSRGMSCLLNEAHWGNSQRKEELSSACLGCHDGSIGRPIGSSCDHPVDVTYSVRSGFHTVTDERIIMVDDKICCLSCHDPYRSAAPRLSKSNEGGALCITCHKK